jgi:hypothetical protein
MSKTKRKTANLEREVIWSVIALYMLICAALLGVHFLQPAGQGTETSSTSPSHDQGHPAPVPDPMVLRAR